MVALKAIDVKNNFKSICSQVFGGETVMLSRPKNQNVVMISEAEYNKLLFNNFAAIVYHSFSFFSH